MKKTPLFTLFILAAALFFPAGCRVLTGEGINASEYASDLSCEKLCGEIQSNCEENNQFDQFADCAERLCTTKNALADGGTPPSTLGCKTAYAILAQDDPNTYCSLAVNDDKCEQGCDVYCSIMTETCSDVFRNKLECYSTCVLFPVSDEPTATTGDNLQCRIYHANIARDQLSIGRNVTAQEHCGHAKPISENNTCAD